MVFQEILEKTSFGAWPFLKGTGSYKTKLIITFISTQFLDACRVSQKLIPHFLTIFRENLIFSPQFLESRPEIYRKIRQIFNKMFLKCVSNSFKWLFPEFPQNFNLYN